MKIGILTYHRSHNYGALLQAIALRKILIDRGHEVFYIDYLSEYHLSMYEMFDKLTFRKSNIVKKIYMLLVTLLNYKEKKKRRENFLKFINKYITPYCVSYNVSPQYDLIIYGSDQIWRKQKYPNNQFDPVFFGQNIVNTKSHASYAASMGKIMLNNDDKFFLKKTLSKFKGISVREEDLREVLLSLDVNAVKTLDPTLMISSNTWDKLIPTQPMHKKKYVLLYELIDGSFDRTQIKKFAQERDCDLIVVEGYPRLIKRVSYYSPDQFLSLIKNAEFVFTTSYHGLCFSIIYEKPFYTSFREGSERAKSLLETLGIEDRLLPRMSRLPTITPAIDYNVIRQKLNKQEKYTNDYLDFVTQVTQ
jgi:hypothetical protein